MIYLGLDDEAKRMEIERYRREHNTGKLIVISADAFPLPVDGSDQVKYSDVIMYVTFYRLLQEIGPETLIVLNECLRTQNRYDLSYNCIRNYLNLTRHQLIFQQLPQIDTAEDFMILFDFDTQSRWKHRGFDPDLIDREGQIMVNPLPLAFERVDIPTSECTREKYRIERDRMFRELGKRDPHIIPRNLYLLGGNDKKAHVAAQDLPLFGLNSSLYVARNKRLNHEKVVAYASAEPGRCYTIVDLPHRFIDFSDFIRRTGQVRHRVLVADIKVDSWYFDRYLNWSRRIHETYANLPAGS